MQMNRINMDSVQKTTINGELISLHWPERSLCIGSDRRHLPENYTEDIANQFVNSVVPNLRTHEIPAALRVYPKSNEHNFWILLFEQLPKQVC